MSTDDARAEWEHYCHDYDVHPSDLTVSHRAFFAGWRAAVEWAAGRAETTIGWGGPRPKGILDEPAETTTATTEDAAEALHGDACPEDPDSGETCGCNHDYYRRQANVLAAHGLLASPSPARTAPTREELIIAIRDADLLYTDNGMAVTVGDYANAVLALLEGGGDQ